MINIVSDIFDKADIEKLHEVLETETERSPGLPSVPGDDIFSVLPAIER